MRRFLTVEDVEFAVLGGSVFACGGGGFADHGRELGRLATSIGRPELISVDELSDDAWIATVAAIGAPGGLTDWQMLGVDYIQAVRMLQDALGHPLSGLMIGQNGMSSTLNAWLPGAVLRIGVLDAVGDLRAHPTGDMGSLGLAASPEPTIQTAAGGNRRRSAYLEMTVRGPTSKISPLLRAAADQAGGFIPSCRNPLPNSVVRERAVCGGISRALELGQAIAAAERRGATAVIDAICRATGGSVIGSGRVLSQDIVYTSEAFDRGSIIVETDQGSLRAWVLNEYMALERDGARIATYPDVITSLSADGRPLSATTLKPGTFVHWLHVPKALIPLAASSLDPTVYPPVERALGIELARYALSGTQP